MYNGDVYSGNLNVMGLNMISDSWVLTILWRSGDLRGVQCDTIGYIYIYTLYIYYIYIIYTINLGFGFVPTIDDDLTATS